MYVTSKFSASEIINSVILKIYSDSITSKQEGRLAVKNVLLLGL